MTENKPELHLHDRILGPTILKLIPRSVTPNQVTGFRLLLTPIVIWMVAVGMYGIAIPSFLFVAFLDAVDGAMARTRNQITEWGKIFDPLADKILIGSIVFVIVFQNLDPFLAIVIVTLEVIFMVAAVLRRRNGESVQANLWGKIKMNLQVISVVLLLIALLTNITSFLPISTGTFYLSVVFAVFSLLTYGI